MAKDLDTGSVTWSAADRFAAYLRNGFYTVTKVEYVRKHITTCTYINQHDLYCDTKTCNYTDSVLVYYMILTKSCENNFKLYLAKPHM